HAIIGADSHTLLVSNLQDGIDIYAILPVQPLRSLKHAIRSNVPLVVSSALEGELVVVSSDDGLVRVYDQCLGTLVTLLPHGYVETLVQITEVFSSEEQCVIATGTSDNGNIKIKVW
ncbi:hypothetical protein BDQ17DRAFT_1208394, partial [Cyathus striatus]